MKRAGFIVALGGLVITILSSLPFLLAVAFSNDPATEPFALEGLLWVGGSFGLIVVVVGLLLAIAEPGERPSQV